MSVRIRVVVALAVAVAAVALMLGAAAAGVLLRWQDDGVVVCDELYDQKEHEAVADGSGGAIVVWRGMSGTTQIGHIYAQRLDADGNSLWYTNGITVSDGTYPNEDEPAVAPDGVGGAFVAWYIGTAYGDVVAQRLDADGNMLWDTGGLTVCTAERGRSSPAMTPDGSGGVIVAWTDTRDEQNTDRDIYAQRFDANGNRLWGTAGISVCTAADEQRFPVIASDGAGGALVTWKDWRKGTNDYNVYVQRLDGNGNTLWYTNGITVCGQSGNQEHARLVSDGSGGAIITWHDYRSGSSPVTGWDVYAQRVDAGGDTVWLTGGVTVCALSNNQEFPEIIPDGSGGAIIAWRDNRITSDTSIDVYAQRLDGDGNALWITDGVTVTAADGAQNYPQIAPYWSGGAVVAWTDKRDGEDDIYAQRLGYNGTVMWLEDGVSICTAEGSQDQPRIVSDDDWGCIVAWRDGRDRDTNDWDIYAQRARGAATVNLPLVMRNHSG